jgi:hypothetical protein
MKKFGKWEKSIGIQTLRGGQSCQVHFSRGLLSIIQHSSGGLRENLLMIVCQNKCNLHNCQNCTPEYMLYML